MMFTARYRVYYEDTDATQVMYHARYLAFFERARTDFLRQLGFSQEQLREQHDLAFTVSDLQVRYRYPARLDDELTISVQVEECRKASLTFVQSMQSESQLCAELTVRAACVDMQRFRPCAMPELIRNALQEHLTSPCPSAI